MAQLDESPSLKKANGKLKNANKFKSSYLPKKVRYFVDYISLLYFK